ncbi:hypothetical protein HPB50_009640 [Hyalomma asiaticum]|uniref:Uncharacterized protein n=1 Tax=Hyalomma asiaticum TaxID=266040 RepID=A0ACB7SFE8_HYAAI|nr:hypothetical protein HPB50_009640 [Hyalomma asiaticum]
MFVLVRFVEDEFDSRRFHVVHSSSIANFSPTDPDDFDKKKIYEVFWIDPNEDGEDTGNYDVQILMMAENRDELDAKVAAKRVPVTNIKLIQPAADTASEARVQNQKILDSSSDEDDSLCLASELKRERVEKNAYKEKAIALEKANEFLMEQVASLQRCLEAKIFDSTLQHWGQRNQVNVAEPLRAVPRLLTEKIQDCRKSLKKQNNAAL